MKEITYENRIAAEFGGAEGLAAHGAMVRDLAASLKGNAKLAGNPALRALLQQRAYANVTVVNAPHAPFSGDHDFSRDGRDEAPRPRQGRRGGLAPLRRASERQGGLIRRGRAPARPPARRPHPPCQKSNRSPRKPSRFFFRYGSACCRPASRS